MIWNYKNIRFEKNTGVLKNYNYAVIPPNLDGKLRKSSKFTQV